MTHQMAAATITSSELNSIKDRFPDAFKRPFLKTFAAPITLFIVVLYFIYVVWFFSVGKVMNEARWDIAGTYLADWISYEVRPDVDYRTGEIKIEYPRFSPLGPDPKPDWVTTTEGTVTLIDTDGGASESKAASGSTFVAPAEAGDTSAKTATGGFSFMSSNSSATNMGSSQEQVEATDKDKEIVTKQGIAEATIVYGTSGQITATPSLVTATRGDEALEMEIDTVAQTVTPRGELPDWALQKEEGGKVFVEFGFAGRAEIRSTEIKINRRFIGWENFFFDPSSPYWEKSFGEVTSLVFSGPRLDESQSNFSLMVDNFLNNAEWQHADVYIKLLQTIVMAFVGTLFAVIIAFPLSFLAARNITPYPVLNQVLKRFFDFMRSVDMLIWALFFTRAFGPGPLAGISAIFFTDTGTFGKLYSEALENIDDKQREGIRSVGASPVAVQRYGVVPQVLPVLISQALYFWESNTRSATIIGAVGAGGIGLKLWEAMRTNQDWENVFYMVILILIVVFVFDAVSNALRTRLIGKSHH